MQKVVIDTNVVVSAVISPTGNPAKIITQLFSGALLLHYCAEILGEYALVLSRSKLKIPPKIQSDILDAIRESGIMIVPSKSDISMTDESDRIFYDTAKATSSFLITGNMKHYPSEDFIVTPAAFLTATIQN